MSYLVLFTDERGRTGVSAIWADGSRWVRFAKSSRKYPRAVYFQSRKDAINHARCVIGWVKRNDTFFNIKFSYSVVPVSECREKSFTK